MEKMKLRIGAGIMLFAMILMTSEYAFAAYDATWSYGGESSYTRSMGCSQSASFYYSIGEAKGAYKAQIKDPNLWRTQREEKNLSKGKKETFKRGGGSKDAHWRGWVKNGYIRVTI